MLSLASALAACAALASAADVSGKWTAQVQRPDGQAHTVTFNLKVSGDQVTGTVTTPRGEAQISDGKVSGNQITFNEVRDFNGHQMTVQYTGTISADGNSIEFRRAMQGGRGGQAAGGEGNGNGGGGRRGGGMNRTITAKRASS